MTRLTRIHVNKHRVAANAKHGRRDPVITVKQGRTNAYGHAVLILGPSEIVYRPDQPLSCGARVWIETQAPVIVHKEARPCSKKSPSGG